MINIQHKLALAYYSMPLNVDASRFKFLVLHKLFTERLTHDAHIEISLNEWNQHFSRTKSSFQDIHSAVLELSELKIDINHTGRMRPLLVKTDIDENQETIKVYLNTEIFLPSVD